MLITVSHINLSFGLHFYFSSSHCVLSGGKKKKRLGLFSMLILFAKSGWEVCQRHSNDTSSLWRLEGRGKGHRSFH